METQIATGQDFTAEQKSESKKLYVVFSEVDEDLPHILGIFSTPEMAKKVCDIDNTDTEARSHMQEFDIDTVYTIDEDQFRFKLAGLETKKDGDGEFFNGLRRFVNLGGPGTILSEEDGWIVQTKRLFKAKRID